MKRHPLAIGVLPLLLVAAGCTGTVKNTGDGSENPATGGSGANPAVGGAAGTSHATGGTGGQVTTGGTGGSATGGVGGGTGGATGGAGGSFPMAGSAGTSPTIPDPAGSIDLEGEPAYYRVVRLTNDQWTNSVQTVLHLPSKPTQADMFLDAVAHTTDFTNNEQVLSVDERGWTDFQAAAEAIATQVTSDAALLSGVYSGTDAAGFISTVGRRAYRRPLTPAEVTKYQALYDSGTALSGNRSAFAKGVSVVLEAMLQSPHFLYRTELGAAGTPLSGYEMAAKLSLWLRNTSPDDALLDKAAMPGALDTADGAALVAQGMLEEPAAKAVMRDFYGQYLHFDRFDLLSKVGVSNYNEAINPELAEASFLFFDRIFNQGLGVADMFLSPTGFVGQRMAALAGAGQAPAAGAFAERDFTGSRRGYFTQLPYLMLHSHNLDPDPIHRGVTLAIDVLCAPLGPPADEIPPLPQRQPGQTNRDVVDAHTKQCGLACHNAMINPLGFAFENYDGMGQYREMEVYPTETLPVDASGMFEFADGVKSWENADGLMQVLATDPQTHICFAKKLAEYGLQRDVVVGDAPLLSAIATTSVSSTGSLKQLMLTLVKQDAFRVRVGGVQ